MSQVLILNPRKDHDHSLRDDVYRVLKETGHTALSQVDCRVDNGVVELSGDVPSFYCKQIAQAVILPLERVREVRNHLQVQ